MGSARNSVVLAVALLAIAGCGADDASPPTSPSGEEGAAGGSTVGGADELEWPNAESFATSDPWIAEHHDDITVMRPRVLALNFVNPRTNEEMMAHMADIVAAIREGSRPHGYADARALPFLEYEIAYAVDLRDDPPPSEWPYVNSTKYPRETTQEGSWSFDYEKLFTREFAALYGIMDGETPLTLCELSERGLVHEVWIYGDADVPDVSAAEILGIMPHYDESFQRIGVELDRCAGNGCFDAEDEIPADCTRTLRIGWVNNTRGVGCYMESLSHGIERIGGGDFIPYWKPYFRELAGFDLNQRYGLPFDSWYACSAPDCLNYATPSSVGWQVGSQSGTIDPYVAICGNAHFPPNARSHYDLVNPQPVLSTCESYRRGGGPGRDPAKATTPDAWLPYARWAPDCTGSWIVYWWQSFPGPEREAQTAEGTPMKNWWPFLFY